MILVKRWRPPRSPADSCPTTSLTGSLLGPVMMRPRESVFTAVVKKRRFKGASGNVERILRSNGAESVVMTGLAIVWKSSAPNTIESASPATAYLVFLIMFFTSQRKYDFNSPPEIEQIGRA